MTSPPTRSVFSLSNVDLGEDIDIAIGATALALTGDQLVKAAHSKKHKTSHLIKAGLGAAVTVAAWKMFHREHHEHDHHNGHHHQHPHSGENRKLEDGDEHRYIRDRSPSPSGSRRFSKSLVRHDQHNRGLIRTGDDGYDSGDDYPRRPNSAHGHPVVRQDNNFNYGQQEPVYGRSRSYSPSQDRRPYWS